MCYKQSDWAHNSSNTFELLPQVLVPHEYKPGVLLLTVDTPLQKPVLFINDVKRDEMATLKLHVKDIASIRRWSWNMPVSSTDLQHSGTGL